MQVHGHSATCRKGKVGDIMCRMARQQACVERTGAVQLDTSIPPPFCHPAKLHQDGNWVPALCKTLEPMQTREQLSDTVPTRMKKAPSMLPDPRVFKVEVLRPTMVPVHSQVAEQVERYCQQHNLDASKDFLTQGGVEGLVLKMLPRLKNRNGYVTEVNDVMSATLRCNTNAQWLGTVFDSQTAMMYLASYMKKEKVDASDILALLASVRRQILTTHKSTAEDAGTAQRTSKHLIARMHNMSLGQQKLAATQCALYLLQTNTFKTSEQFRTLHYSCARDYICHHRTQQLQDMEMPHNDTADDADADQERDDCNTAWYRPTRKGNAV